MKLNKDIELSIDLITVLNHRLRTVAELAYVLGTTEAFLAQIVNKLKKAGIVRIKRGPGGGVMAGNATQVSLADICCALGHSVIYTESPTYSSKVQNRMMENLASITITYGVGAA